MMKKKLSLLLVICLVFTLMMPVSASADSKPSVTVNFIDTGYTVSIEGTEYPVWKMVVGTGASMGIQVFGTVFSMDKSVITPVDENGPGDYSISEITFSPTEPVYSY